MLVSLSHRRVDETSSNSEIVTFIQKDMSDSFYGPGVDELRSKLTEYKEKS